MRRVRRALKLLLFIVMVTILVPIGLLASVTARGLAQTDGTIHIPGLHGDVTIQRDRAGIAQITAADPHDLFLGQGFVHAQERMWQMEISRRIGSGRLAELFGPSVVDTDRYVRTLGWRVAAQRDLDAMAPNVKDDLQAYADGVNAWIHAHDGNLSLPFVVAGLKSGLGGLGGLQLEDWTPLDSAGHHAEWPGRLGRGRVERRLDRLDGLDGQRWRRLAGAHGRRDGGLDAPRRPRLGDRDACWLRLGRWDARQPWRGLERLGRRRRPNRER